LRKPGIENLDELVNNLAYELSQYFNGENYGVGFVAKPIPLENKPINVEELLKPFVTTQPSLIEGLNSYQCDGLNQKDYKRNGLKTVNIQEAKATLKKLITDEELNQGKKINKRAFERIDKLWQLISHYVSFNESKIYFYDSFLGMGIFWSYSLLIVDKQSNYAFFLGAGAWD